MNQKTKPEFSPIDLHAGVPTKELSDKELAELQKAIESEYPDKTIEEMLARIAAWQEAA